MCFCQLLVWREQFICPFCTCCPPEFLPVRFHAVRLNSPEQEQSETPNKNWPHGIADWLKNRFSCGVKLIRMIRIAEATRRNIRYDITMTLNLRWRVAIRVSG